MPVNACGQVILIVIDDPLTAKAEGIGGLFPMKEKIVGKTEVIVDVKLDARRRD